MFGMNLTKHERMYAAINRGDAKAVQKFIDRGFDVNDETWSGMSPLLAAVAAGKVEVAELLIRQGADFAKYYHHWETTGQRHATLAHIAAERGDKDMLLMLLERDKYDRTFINKVDGHRNTALHCAALAGHKEIIEVLLAHGFDPAIKGANDKLAIGYAFQGKHQDVVDLLSSIKKPEPKVVAPPPPAKWKKVSDSSIATVSAMPELGYQITEVFNFVSRERIRIVNNLKTRADNIETTPFDNLADRRQLEEAYAALKELGGDAPAAMSAKPRLHAPERKP
jgi:ankyrin repeat protein